MQPILKLIQTNTTINNIKVAKASTNPVLNISLFILTSSCSSKGYGILLPILYHTPQNPTPLDLTILYKTAHNLTALCIMNIILGDSYSNKDYDSVRKVQEQAKCHLCSSFLPKYIDICCTSNLPVQVLLFLA